MSKELFELAIAKRNIPLIEKLIPYQKLSPDEKYSIIKKFMYTPNSFIVPLIETLETKQHIQECLYLALMYKKLDVVKLLLGKGADPNEPNKSGQVPLSFAFSPNQTHKELIETLLNHGADINGKNKWNSTPVNTAASTGNVELLKFLEEKGATLNADVLKAAATSDQFEIVGYLLSKGIEVSHKTYFMAMMMNKKEMVDYLFQQDRDFKLIPKPQYNVLSMAAYKNYKDLLVNMMERGLPDDTKEKRLICSSALISAIDSGQFHLLPIFLEYGADINFISDDETPLDVARATGNSVIIKWIKERGGVSSGIKKLPR
jgi:ankyrin repeat protein